MWVVIAILVASVILSILLAPNPEIENARPNKFGDFSFPRSNEGDPIPLVWGTVRQKSPLVIWYGDYRAFPITKTVKTGFFSSSVITTGYKNSLGMDLALCLGPNVKLKKFWADKDLVWEGNLSTETSVYINWKPEDSDENSGKGGLSGTMFFYDGRNNPSQSTYLQGVIGPNVPAYNGVARVLFGSFYIGNSTTPPAFSFEISRLTTSLNPATSIMPNGLDANPMEVIYDALTGGWGTLGNNAADLDISSFISAATTLHSEQLGVSIIAQASMTAKDLIEEVLRVADGILYQDPATGKIKAKLIREDYTIGTLLVLDETSISKVSNFQKSTWDSTFNQCRVTFNNRENNYDKSVAVAQDFANVVFQNQVRSTEINVPSCKDPTNANEIAARQLSLLSVPLYKCKITVNRKASVLRPGDVFVFNWKPFNISNIVMRVASIDYGDLTEGSIVIDCVQDKFATQTVIFANPNPTAWTPISTTPSPVISRRLFTPPAFLISTFETETLSDFETKSRLYLVAQSPSGASIGFDRLRSTDNFASVSIQDGDNLPYKNSGSLVGDYLATAASVSRHDTSGITVANMTSSDIASLKQYSTLDQARDGSALMLIDDELFIYVGFVDNLDGTVTFNSVYRSILDTAPATHLSGAQVWFIDGLTGLCPELMSVGETRHFKLLDITVDGRYDEALATSFSGIPTNRASFPLPPAYMTIENSRNPPTYTAGTLLIQVAWRNRSRLDTFLRAYDDASDVRESGTQTRIRWRMDADPYTTVDTTLSSYVIDLEPYLEQYGPIENAQFAVIGTLEVVIDTEIISNSKFSTVSETMTLDVNYIT